MGISKSQTYGSMKKGLCTKCGKDVSKLSWKQQQDHEFMHLKEIEEKKNQTKLF
ncbi:hypothetical protein LCGC14_0380400 [marine sediment metagenome]|uniref:Uncharacterized protein n=1 Tax=marine sediment metagenome TaxID=412755 RepID=A0A0F9T8C1_9ZZZZ